MFWLSVLLLANLLAMPVAGSAQEVTTAAAPKLTTPSAAGPGEPMPRAINPAALQLPRLGRALRTTQTAKVLAIGSSSTAGVGASAPSMTYTARLEADLESALTGTDFDVVGHGLSGEMAQGAADRMKREVEDVKPDLVIWQVGTNDALRHVAIDNFKACLKKTLAWLKQQDVDVILINPQYGDSLTKDAYYEEVVQAVAEVARDTQVLLADRFASMRKLQKEHGDRFYLSADNLHMNDEGYRCLAEQVAATIIAALPQAPSSNVGVLPTASGPMVSP